MAAFPIFKTIMRGLFGKSATVLYPLEPKPLFEATRGHMEIDAAQCIFCGICQKKCPTGAITVNRAEKTWSIARNDCLQCNCCAEVCPKKVLHMENKLPEAGYEPVTHTVRQPG